MKLIRVADSGLHFLWLLRLLLALPALYFLLAFVLGQASANQPCWRFYCAMALAFLAVSWSGRAHSGGYLNVLLPAMAALAVLSGLILAAALRRGSYRLSMVVLMICTAQFWLLRYNPSQEIPTAADRAAGQQLHQVIRTFPGDVYIPFHSFYTAQVGKRTYAHWSAIADVGGLLYTTQAAVPGSGTEERRAIILDEMAKALSTGRFDAVILDESNLSTPYISDLLSANYRQQGVVFPAGLTSTFWARTFPHPRPQFIFVRKAPES